MSLQLDRAELSGRLRSQGDNLLVQVAAMVQGGVLSAAAYSLIEIFRLQDDTPMRLMLWIISVMIGLLIFFRLCIRAPFLTRAGLDVLFMVPVMGVCEIVMFAVISTTALGPDSWRFWFAAALMFGVAGYLATWLNLRAVRDQDYDDDIRAVALALRTTLRRTLSESVVGLVVTILLAAPLFAMGADWRHGLVIVAIQLAFALVFGPLTVRQEAREAEALRRALDV